MQASERDIENALATEALEREAAIAGIGRALAGHGSDDCDDCGGDIEPLRRKAMPSARRCIGCQIAFERARLRRAN